MLNGSCELVSVLSHTQMEGCQTDVGAFQSPAFREALVMNSFINSFNK